MNFRCHSSNADYPCARRASNQATAKSVTAARPKATLSPSIRRLAAVGGEIYAAERVLECLLLANSGLFGTVPRTSALPLKADVAAVGRESPKLTHLRHWRRP